MITSEYFRFLGIESDNNLNWSNHVNKVTKINKAYYVITNMKDTLDARSMLRLYNALVYSHIAYNFMGKRENYKQGVNWA